MTYCTREKKNEAGWALLLFKDFIAKHGDTLLTHLLNSKVPVAPHFDFTKKYSNLKTAFENNQRIAPGLDYLWRVETDLGGGGAHHFIVYVGNTTRTLTVLDPAFGVSGRKTVLNYIKYT